MDPPILSVASLHAITYCERLFYFEEIERVRVADAAIFAGRRVHEELRPGDDEGELVTLSFESGRLGLRGSIDVLRRRDGQLIPYEHKKGRSAGRPNAREAWQTDRVQVAAYALLVEEAHGQSIPEGRVRYHADHITVRVPIDDTLRADVHAAIMRARQLLVSTERPPIAANERLCVRCALAPICLPEETRLAHDPAFHPIRLLPPHPNRKTLHVSEPGATIGRSGDEFLVRSRDGGEYRLPVTETGQVVVHGMAQISTQAIRLCAEHDIGVHWMTAGGSLVGSLAPTAPMAQRHLRQMRALSNEQTCLTLAQRLVNAKVEAQLRFLLRATRERVARSVHVEEALNTIRSMLARASRSTTVSELLGVEGSAAAAYFSCWPELLSDGLDERMRFDGRSRRPPKDRINALISYGYGILYREVLAAIIGVGLHPGIGFYHQPRTAAHPLALDLMELFRVPLVDMALLAAVNRKTFDPQSCFTEAPGQVLLSEAGRRGVIEVIERRNADEWRHSAVGYSLSWARIIELEVRLLEKEWTDHTTLFARFRLR